MAAYYNENDRYPAQWLRNLMAAGLIPQGEVDERSIVDVQPDDLRGFVQCHFFAGIAGWALAARLAGWPYDRELWTGSCPCQPFSVAGKGLGAADDRHLWPHWFRLIRERRPGVVMGEQVAAAIGHGWLDGVFADLEGEGYACEAAIVPACAVNAPHQRDRVWFVADSESRREVPVQQRGQWGGAEQSGSTLADASSLGSETGLSGSIKGQEGIAGVSDYGRDKIPMEHSKSVRRGEGRSQYELRSGRPTAAGASGSGAVGNTDQHDSCERRQPRSGQLGGTGSDPWSDSEWLQCADGKSRRVKSGIRLMAHGVPVRASKLRALGNAIVPQVAAEIIGAYLDCRP